MIALWKVASSPRRRSACLAEHLQQQVETTSRALIDLVERTTPNAGCAPRRFSRPCRRRRRTSRLRRQRSGVLAHGEPAQRSGEPNMYATTDARELESCRTPDGRRTAATPAAVGGARWALRRRSPRRPGARGVLARPSAGRSAATTSASASERSSASSALRIPVAAENAGTSAGLAEHRPDASERRGRRRADPQLREQPHRLAGERAVRQGAGAARPRSPPPPGPMCGGCGAVRAQWPPDHAPARTPVVAQ